jgi:hypothetical protein
VGGGGGAASCAVGVVRDVSPPPPMGCVRSTLPWHTGSDYVRTVAASLGHSLAAKGANAHLEGVYKVPIAIQLLVVMVPSPRRSPSRLL